jgi:hypothetical protein
MVLSVSSPYVPFSCCWLYIQPNVLVISKEAIEFDPETWFTCNARYSYDCILLRTFFVWTTFQDLITEHLPFQTAGHSHAAIGAMSGEGESFAQVVQF